MKLSLEIGKHRRGQIVAFLLGAAVMLIILIYFVPPFVNVNVRCESVGALS